VLVPLIGASLLWLPLVNLCVDGVGFALGFVHPVIASAMLSPVMTPFAAMTPGQQRPWLIAALAVSALAIGAQLALPPYTPPHPQPVNVVFWQDQDERRATWCVDSLGRPPPVELARAMPFVPEVDALPHAMTGHPVLVAPARLDDSRTPEFEPRAHAPLRPTVLRGWLRTRPGATRCGVMVPPGSAIELVKLGATPVPPPAHRFDMLGGWQNYEMVAPGERLPLEIVFGAGGRTDLWLWEAAERLPDGGDLLLASRPPYAVPYGVGDRATWWRHLQP